jgi:short-subunit dehydrogenase
VTAAWRDRVVLVTGASQGIGRCLALALARQGARIGLVARTEARLAAVAAECADLGADALAIPADITDQVACARAVQAVVDRFGRLDALVNNAGLSVVARFDAIEDLELAERTMRVNYLGAVYCTRAALPHLVAARGRLVAVASLTGKAGVPLRSVYAASKHAMVGFFDSIRIELRSSGVSVTVAYPDFVQTEVRERVLGPRGERLAIQPQPGVRFMTAEDCAERILAAVDRRRRDVILSARGRFGKWLQVIAPGLVDRIAERAMRRVRYGRDAGTGDGTSDA